MDRRPDNPERLLAAGAAGAANASWAAHDVTNGLSRVNGADCSAEQHPGVPKHTSESPARGTRVVHRRNPG